MTVQCAGKTDVGRTVDGEIRTGNGVAEGAGASEDGASHLTICIRINKTPPSKAFVLQRSVAAVSWNASQRRKAQKSTCLQLSVHLSSDMA